MIREKRNRGEKRKKKKKKEKRMERKCRAYKKKENERLKDIMEEYRETNVKFFCNEVRK